MNKNRIEGAMQQAKGSLKQTAGKALGNARLENEGKADKAKGTIQNAVGKAEDILKE